MIVESPITRLADAQVAKRACISVVIVGLAARLTCKGVVAVDSSVHKPVLLEATVVRILDGVSFDNGVAVNGLTLPGWEAECARVWFDEALHLGV